MDILKTEKKQELQFGDIVKVTEGSLVFDPGTIAVVTDGPDPDDGDYVVKTADDWTYRKASQLELVERPKTFDNSSGKEITIKLSEKEAQIITVAIGYCTPTDINVSLGAHGFPGLQNYRMAVLYNQLLQFLKEDK